MTKALWNDMLIAESDDTIVVDGNHYFPRDSVNTALLRDSATTSVCGWKGVAKYHSVEVDGKVNKDAAWYYPEPKTAAANIADRIAFWKGVAVT